MRIDLERLQKYLSEIKSRHDEIEELLGKRSDADILEDPWVLKGVKYALIEMAEAMANILQHVLAKEKGKAVAGYIETITEAGEAEVIPQQLAAKLRPFFSFRNALIHRYWFISDEKFIALLREHRGDFPDFIEAIEGYMKKGNKPSGQPKQNTNSARNSTEKRGRKK